MRVDLLSFTFDSQDAALTGFSARANLAARSGYRAIPARAAKRGHASCLAAWRRKGNFVICGAHLTVEESAPAGAGVPEDGSHALPPGHGGRWAGSVRSKTRAGSCACDFYRLLAG